MEATDRDRRAAGGRRPAPADLHLLPPGAARGGAGGAHAAHRRRPRAPAEWRAPSWCPRRPSRSASSAPSGRSATPASRTACPTPPSCPARLTRCWRVLYLVFNEGYLASAASAPSARDLRATPMAHVAARRADARRAGAARAAGADAAAPRARRGPLRRRWRLVLLPDQDRPWDRPAIGEADALVERALRMGRAGPYQLQAAIVAVHAGAAPTGHRLGGDRRPLRPPVASSRRRWWRSTVRWPWPSCAGRRWPWPRSIRWPSGSTAITSTTRRGAAAAAAGPPGGGASRRPAALRLTGNPAERRLLEERLAAESA